MRREAAEAGVLILIGQMTQTEVVGRGIGPRDQKQV